MRSTFCKTMAAGIALVVGLGSTPAAFAETVRETAPVARYESVEDYRAAVPGAEEEPVALTAQSANWRRLAGATRYETMSAIASEAFVASDWAVLASDDNFPDALSASALAGACQAPILLAGRYGLPAETVSQLRRLLVKHVYIVGGEAAVGTEVEWELANLGIDVMRVAGSTRQETSLAVARELRRIQATGDAAHASDVVVVATGASFADALSIAPWAYATASPILLTAADGTLSAEQLEAVRADSRVSRIVVVGGQAAVDDSVAEALPALAFERISGSDRYRTSAAVAEWESTHGFGWNGALVATGRNYPDALTGASLAGSLKSPLMLGEDTKQATFATLRQHEGDITYGYLLGGPAAEPVEDPLEFVAPTDPMSLKAQEYSSPTGLLILIDCTANVCGIYEGSQGAWSLADQFQVTTGKAATPTVRGTFSIYDHGYAFDGDVYTCYYYSCFSGPYYMHSIIYAKHTFDVLDDQIGTNASMGCVRMPIEKAKWVYENAPIGTTVVTY